MSKAILANKEVMNLILISIIGNHCAISKRPIVIIKHLLSLGNHAKDLYIPRTCEWIDSNRADIIYGPIMPASNLLPLIIIEVQSAVDELFMHRLQKYCNHVYETFDNIKPITLPIFVKSIREIFTKVMILKKVNFSNNYCVSTEHCNISF